MGLTSTDIDLLLDLRSSKFSCKRIATIGSLSLYLHPRHVRRLKKLLPNSVSLLNYRWGDTADSVLKDITGATDVISIDVSDYQGSSIVHDMNLPLAQYRPDLAGQFDLVIDGGTLEHVFNFPVAVVNMMFLLSKGGHILTANPANNLCGHGFYQFSPELMHRIYSAENGFRVITVLLTEARQLSVEMDPSPASYRVTDPMTLGRRVLTRNRHPVMIRTLAEKVSDQSSKGLNVQQSDYVVAWSGGKRDRDKNSFKKVLRIVFDRLPLKLQTKIIDIVSHNNLHDRSAMQRYTGRIE